MFEEKLVVGQTVPEPCSSNICNPSRCCEDSFRVSLNSYQLNFVGWFLNYHSFPFGSDKCFQNICINNYSIIYFNFP